MRVDHLPEKLRLSVLDVARSQPIRGLVLACQGDIRVKLKLKAHQAQPETRVYEWTQSIGTLATDHVGYISFSLRALKELPKRLTALGQWLAKKKAPIEIVDFEAGIVSLTVTSPLDPSVSAELIDRLLPATLPPELDEGAGMGVP